MEKNREKILTLVVQIISVYIILVLFYAFVENLGWNALINLHVLALTIAIAAVNIILKVLIRNSK